MFVDACALVAMLAKELEAEAYAQALDDAEAPWTSALAAFEAMLVLARPDKLGGDVQTTHEIVMLYLDQCGIALRELGPQEEILRGAVWVAQRHGISRKKLSVFDCFHYAAAKTAGSPMLTLDKLLRDTDVPTLP